MSKKYVVICRDEITRETEKAIFVQGVWLPKSQLMVVVNNMYLDIDTKEIKEHKVKSLYCMLLPMWLYMKNCMCDKRGYTLEKLISDFNTDKRIEEEYEGFKVVTYQEYKEGLNNLYN